VDHRSRLAGQAFGEDGDHVLEAEDPSHGLRAVPSEGGCIEDGGKGQHRHRRDD
jgi:hypothetical protein